MESLFIEGTKMTPMIQLNRTEAIFEIKGTSRPENTKAFYQPVFDWFKSYFIQPNSETKILICLQYFNTSTSKTLLDLLEMFEENIPDSILIQWAFERGDEEMKEAGEELLDLVNLKFELIEVEEA